MLSIPGWISGRNAQLLMGPAIGAGVAFAVGRLPRDFSSLIAGAVGREPSGRLRRSGRTGGGSCGGLGRGGLPLSLEDRRGYCGGAAATIVAGGTAGIFAGPAVAGVMHWLGGMINSATNLHPIPMGVVLSVVMGLVLTLPFSSAALSISLGLSGLAAGASTVGCCCQMIGFAVAGYRENGVGGLISQGLGTSMLQMPNIIKNPWIWVPPTAASALLGPLSATVFRMENNSIGAGMGTSGLVGQFSTMEVMGPSSWPSVLILHFILPGALPLSSPICSGRRGLSGKGI